MSNPWTLSAKTSSNSMKNKRREKNNFEDMDQYSFRSAREELALSQMSTNNPIRKSLMDSSDTTINSTTSNRNHTRSMIASSSQPANLPIYQPFQPNYNIQNKRLGVTGPYINPMRKSDDNNVNNAPSYTRSFNQPTVSSSKPVNFSANAANAAQCTGGPMSDDLIEVLNDERAKNLDKNIVERILNEIIEKKSEMNWDQIGGLTKVKEELEEIVMLPMKRPDLFVDLLSPCKGLLLFGPPGTGKTLIGKCIASQSNSTFFSISASSLTSKWVGEAEKLVRALFVIARIRQPSVIFIDEIDSLLTQRSEDEHESSRRIKTEFLVQFDGMSTETKDNLLVIGATNLPHSLDEAARRRFTKRLYIPLPNLSARIDIINLLMRNQPHDLDERKILKLCRMTKGYSGADLSQLCKDAALNIIRRFGKSKIMDIKGRDDLPAIAMQDFLNAIQRVKPSVSDKDLKIFQQWNATFGAVQHYEDDEEDFTENGQRSIADVSLVVLN